MAALLLCILVVSAICLATRHNARAAMLRSDPEAILADPALRRTAMALGSETFRARCAACHGSDGRGDHGGGTPDLADHDHLYGQGRVAEIEQIVRYGIRSGDARGWNLASMPAYALPRPYSGEPLPSLSPAEVADLTQYILGFTGRATDDAAAARGRTLFTIRAGCWDCHSRDAQGDPAIGAPNLTDRIWLYGGGSAAAISRSIAQGRAGFSPAFADTLTPAEIRAVAVYVAALEAGR